MQMGYIDKIKIYLKENLSEEKFSHSLGCAEAASAIAQKVGFDVDKAYLAGLLHDCAKSMNRGEMLALCSQGMIVLEEGEADNDKVLHAPAGRVVASKIFDIVDEDILSAIRWHTLGKVEMSVLEKIVFLAV